MEGLSGVGGTDFHSFACGIAVCHDDGAAGVFAISEAGESDAVGIIEIDVLLAVGVVFAGVEEGGQAGDLFQDDVVILTVAAFVGVFGTEEIRVKNTWISFRAEEDEGVGVGFEPGFNRSFEGLEGLGVVVIDESDCEQGICQHQRMIKDGAEVVIAAGLAGGVEIVVERGIEKAHGAIGGGDVALEKIEVARCPVLSDSEDVFRSVFPEEVQPFLIKFRRNVFHRIQADAVEWHLFMKPFSPVIELGANVGVAGFDIT